MTALIALAFLAAVIVIGCRWAIRKYLSREPDHFGSSSMGQ